MSNAKTMDPKAQTAPAAKVPTEAEKRTAAEIAVAKEVLSKARRGRNPVDPNESKDKKFRRLANKRVPKALKAISYVQNLANTSQYDYTSEQAIKILEALRNAVKSVDNAFNGEKKAAESFTV